MLSGPGMSSSGETYKLRPPGGYAGLKRVMKWNLDFMSKSDEGKAYLDVAKRVDEAIQARTPQCTGVALWICRKASALGCMPATTFYLGASVQRQQLCARLRCWGRAWHVAQAAVPHCCSLASPMPVQMRG